MGWSNPDWLRSGVEDEREARNVCFNFHVIISLRLAVGPTMAQAE